MPVHVSSAHFDETMRGIMRFGNLDGLMVTVPFKSRIMPFVDRVVPMGAKVGAINAIRREVDGTWTGDMFDGTGLIRGLANRFHFHAGPAGDAGRRGWRRQRRRRGGGRCRRESRLDFRRRRRKGGGSRRSDRRALIPDAPSATQCHL